MPNKNWWIGALAVVVTAACLAKIFHGQFGGGHHVNVEPFAALGGLVAEETAKALGPRGRVLVLAVDTATYKIATLDTLLASFRKTLASKGNFTIAAVEKFRVPPTTFMALSEGAVVPPRADLTAAQFTTLLTACSNVDAMVSFVGLPPVAAAELGAIKQKTTKIVVVSERDPQLLSLLQSGAIQVAVVAREEPSTSATKTKSAREWLSQHYEVLTR
jgi:hypothetical protein